MFYIFKRPNNITPLFLSVNFSFEYGSISVNLKTYLKFAESNISGMYVGFAITVQTDVRLNCYGRQIKPFNFST